jgi:hypothetical protein
LRADAEQIMNCLVILYYEVKHIDRRRVKNTRWAVAAHVLRLLRSIKERYYSGFEFEFRQEDLIEFIHDTERDDMVIFIPNYHDESDDCEEYIYDFDLEVRINVKKKRVMIYDQPFFKNDYDEDGQYIEQTDEELAEQEIWWQRTAEEWQKKKDEVLQKRQQVIDEWIKKTKFRKREQHWKVNLSKESLRECDYLDL